MSAFPSLLSVTQSVRAANSLTHPISLPATVDAGDVLLIIVSFDGQPTLTWDNTTAGTWNLLHDTKSATSHTLVAYWKVADGTEDGKTVTPGTTLAEQSEAICLRYSGASGVVAATPTTNTSGVVADPPNLDAGIGASDIAWVAAVGINCDATASCSDLAGWATTTLLTSSISGGTALGYTTKTERVAAQNPAAFTIAPTGNHLQNTYAILPAVREASGEIQGTACSVAADGTVPPRGLTQGRADVAGVGSALVYKVAASQGQSVAAAIGQALSAAAGVSFNLATLTAERAVIALGIGRAAGASLAGVFTDVVITGEGVSRGHSQSTVGSTAYHLRAPRASGSSASDASWIVSNKQQAQARGFGATSTFGSAIVSRVGFSLAKGQALGKAILYDPPAPGFLFTNNALSYLAADLPQGDSVLRVPPGTAGQFPVPQGTERFVGFLQDGKQETEIVYVTANPLTGLMAVQRGQEGTAATTWQAGTLFYHALSADSLDWIATGGAAAIVLDNFNTELAAQAAAIAALRVVVGDLAQSSNEGLNGLRLQIEQAQVAVTQQGLAFTDLTYAFGQLRTEVTATLASNSATIISIMETTANSYEALASFRTEVTAELNGVLSQVVSESEARAEADSALALQLSSLTAVVNDNTAQIENLFTVSATNYESLASLITGLTATVEDNVAAINAESTARADADEALAELVTEVTAVSNAASAAVAEEISSRVAADGVIAGDLLTVTARLDTAESSVSILSSAQADLLGNLASFYAVELDADGVFAGFSLTAGTNALGVSVSEMKVRVGNFTIYNNTDAPVFAVTGGVTLIQNVIAGWAVIENAVVENFVATNANIGVAAIERANIAALAVGSAEIDTLAVGTIHIDNAAVSDYALAFTQAAVSPPISVGTEQLLQQVAYTTEGGRVHVRFSCWLSNGSGPTTDAKLIVKRKNLVTDEEVELFSESMFFNLYFGTSGAIFGRPFYEIIDYPLAAEYLWTLWIDFDSLDGRSYSPSRRLLIVEEVKK